VYLQDINCCYGIDNKSFVLFMYFLKSHQLISNLATECFKFLISSVKIMDINQ
jgi:hypothetical protein